MSNRRFSLSPFTFPLGCACVLSLSAQLDAADWPGFRGAHANGVAEDEKLPLRFDATSNLVWKTEAPAGLSSPLIWKDQLFMTGEAGNQLKTCCLDAASGKKRWEKGVTVEELEPVHKVNSHATSTPVTDGKAVYVYFGSFGLLAYDFQGKEIWRKPLPVPQTFFNQGTGTSPILAEDKLLVFVQRGAESHLLAVNATDGRELWRAPMPVYNNSYSTPVLWQEESKGFVGLTCAGRFTAFTLADGKEAWWLDGLGVPGLQHSGGRRGPPGHRRGWCSRRSIEHHAATGLRGSNQEV